MGSSGRVIATADILDGTITPADIDPQSTIDRIMASNGAGVVGWNQLRNGMVFDRELTPIKVAPGGVASTVMRTSDGTTASFGKIQAADMDALPGSSVVMLLNHVENTDLFNNASWAANVSQPFGTAKSFTVQSATSLVEIAVKVGIYNTSTPGNIGETQSLLIVDGAVVYRLGSAGSNSTSNPFAGAQPVYITGLSAGAHSVQVWAFGNGTTNGWYCRCASQPTLEYFTIQVIEHKIGLGIKGDKGDAGASAQTAGGPKLQLNYTYAGADINGVATTANNWTTILTLPSFTTESASSLVSISIQTGILFGTGTAAASNAGRWLVDGVGVLLGAAYHGTDMAFMNPAAGGSTAWLGPLAAGSHTLAFQVFTGQASQLVYLRTGGGGSATEYFKAQVIEHKQGGLAWTPQGAWSSATSYNVNDVVAQNGSSYVALQTNLNQAPASNPTVWMQIAAKGDPGMPIVWRGLWSAGAAYVVNDAVTNAGTTYICILASAGHNPASDGGVHWQVMVAPGSMVNPMTTADDIIKGGSAGVPNRVAKGAASTVFGVDASGVLGYRQVNSADIQDGSILGTDINSAANLSVSSVAVPLATTNSYFNGGNTGQGDVRANVFRAGVLETGSLSASGAATVGGLLTANGGLNVAAPFNPPASSIGSVHIADGSILNGDIAAQTIRGGVDGGAGRIVPGSLSGSDIAAETITSGHIVDGTIRYYEIGSRQITAYSFINFTHTARVGGGWTYFGGATYVPGQAGQTAVLCIVSCTLQSDTPNAILSVGVGVDSTNPAWITNTVNPSANTLVNITMSVIHLLDTAARTYYPVMSTNAGTYILYSTAQFSVVGFHR